MDKDPLSDDIFGSFAAEEVPDFHVLIESNVVSQDSGNFSQRPIESEYNNDLESLSFVSYGPTEGL